MMKKQEFVPRKISEKPLYELKSVEDIPVSELYQVKINGKEQRVYHTEFFDFVSFLDENEKAEVEVTVNEPFQKAVIRPTAVQIPFKEEGNKISISLPAGKRITLELDDKLESPLYVLPGKYIPKPENATYVFESGKAYNGILYGGNWHAWDENGAEQLIVPVLGENIEIRGITLLDGGSWHIVPVACKNVLIEDVNVLGKVITGDGVDIVGCENVVLRNCFIRANDDCISIKAVEFQDPSGCTDVKHILVEDCLFWNAEFGNTLEIGYETRCDEITDVVFRNCDVVHCQYEGNQSGGVLTIHNADRAHVHDIVYENIRIEDAQEKFIDIKTLDSKYSRDRERGMVNDIFFKNIEITEGTFPVSIIRGFEMKNEVCRPHGFYFDNVVIHGEKVMSPGELHMVVELSDELKFQ